MCHALLGHHDEVRTVAAVKQSTRPYYMKKWVGGAPPQIHQKPLQ